MIVAQTNHQASQSDQQTLVVQLLKPLLARRRPQRILVIKHAGTRDLPLALACPAQVVRLSNQNSTADAMVRCRISALPFEESAIDLVILHHLVGDGGESFLHEILRVMAPGGDLVISGLNSSGLRNRIGNRHHQLPALHVNSLCAFLKSQSFLIENCLLMGMAGLSWPAPRATWYGLGLPFADRVVLHGHHQSNFKNTSILSFKKIRSTRVVPATLDVVSNRKAAS
jgi:SAM-dependent methyltransferase